MVCFPIENCLAASSVNSGHSIFTDSVREESRFNDEIDDPLYFKDEFETVNKAR